MAFNKKKALEEAARLVSQRRISQAIKTYQAISEHDPQDLPLLNIIGDLCVREGNNSEALVHFHKLADAYTSEGFTLKAIAIFKKIVKQDSESVDALVRLAELYAAQKLSHEANEQYAQALALCRRKSLREKEGQILKKLLSQDPGNTAYRLKLAEHFRAAGKLSEAGNAFLEAARTFCLQKNHPAASAALKKAAEAQPESTEVALLEARLAAESGRFEEAEQFISRFPELKFSAAGLSLLMTAFLGSGQLEKASSLATEACRNSPEGLAAVRQYITHCVQSGASGAALPALAGIAKIVPEKVKPEEFSDLMRQTMDARPSNLPVLDRLLDLCGRAWGEGVPSALLESLGKAYGAAGEWIKAQVIFQRLSAREAGNAAWRSLLEESRQKGRGGEHAGARLSASESVPSQGGAESQAGGKSEPLEISEGAGPQADALGVAGVDLDFSSEWASFTAARPAETPKSAAARQDVSDAEEGKSEIEFYLDHGLLSESGAALERFSLKFPGHPYAVELRDRLALLMASPKEMPGEAFLAAGEGTVEPPPSLALAESRGPSESEEWVENGAPMQPARAEQESPASPEHASLAASRQTAGGAAAPSQFTPNDESPLDDLARDLEISWGPAEPQAEGGSAAPPPPSGDVIAGSPASALGEVAGDFEMSPKALDGAAMPFSAAQSITESGASSFDSSLEELLSELNAGEESAPADDTPQTHYNLGIAFREMGLLEEAISEFQKVVKGAALPDSSPRFLEACSMLGICFMEKGMPEIAIRWLLRALESPGLNEDTVLALTYDLAAAYELSGDRKTALEKFSAVYSVNIDYRDVADKIQALQSQDP